MKRLCLAIMIVLASVLPARAQTVMPIPLAQWLGNTGLVLDAGGLCVFNAGASTLATTYTTAALSVANANPVLFNSAGRPTSGGVFLTNGQSFKFILKDFTGISSKTCIPDTGTTLWSVDNVQAVPGSAAAVDVTATAGEAIVAGDAVYLSTGSGSLTQGQIYKMDADLTYKSTGAVMVGIAPNAIASGSSGTMRISGAVTMAGPLSSGSPYYASGTAGSITITPPTNAIRLGQARSATDFIVGYTAAPIGPRGPPCGRLTLTTGLPVTFADVTAATTIFYTPSAGCNRLALFDGTAWADAPFAQLSIAVPATTSQMYDVFVYDNAGVLALELNATSRTDTTGLTLTNGAYLKTGALTRLYLGSFRTTTVSGQTEDSLAKRLLFNYFNRVDRPMAVIEATNTWTYTLAAYHQANANAANQLEFVVGVAEDAIEATVYGMFQQDNVNIQAGVAIGLDSLTTPATNNARDFIPNWGAGRNMPVKASVRLIPTVGRHVLVWLESSEAGTGTTTWIGDNGGVLIQTGIFGMWRA